MTKRDLLRGLTATGLLAAAPARAASGRIATDGVILVWRHAESRLFAEFSAPAPGWVAVGFNATHGLAGTRFVIAAPARIEERLALVPDHVRVESRGLGTGLGDASFARVRGTAVLRFSLPHRFPDSPELRLDAGHRAHVMLAWSHDDDFAHHSAWRRHFDAVL
jgi:hypothetical protein